MENTLTCEYCGAVKNEVVFVIGASKKPEWVMNEGSGKISCPACFEKGKKEGQMRIDAHVKSFSK